MVPPVCVNVPTLSGALIVVVPADIANDGAVRLLLMTSVPRLPTVMAPAVEGPAVLSVIVPGEIVETALSGPVRL